MIIDAIFTGMNGSMGLITGKRYTMQIFALPRPGDGPHINTTINGEGNVFPCPYSNIDTFLSNWDLIRVCNLEIKKPEA